MDQIVSNSIGYSMAHAGELLLVLVAFILTWYTVEAVKLNLHWSKPLLTIGAIGIGGLYAAILAAGLCPGFNLLPGMAWTGWKQAALMGLFAVGGYNIYWDMDPEGKLWYSIMGKLPGINYNQPPGGAE